VIDNRPDHHGTPANTAPILKLHSISKSFPGVRALHDVSLQLAAGEIVAIVGENGAGKSTLLKVLGGIHAPDAGEIEIDGRLRQLRSVRHAMDLGISLIHQELNLAANLSIAENIFLGKQPT
jgi:ribose transport system ATP-binding protein